MLDPFRQLLDMSGGVMCLAQPLPLLPSVTLADVVLREVRKGIRQRSEGVGDTSGNSLVRSLPEALKPSGGFSTLCRVFERPR